jgi:hypothetical protein
VVGLAARKRRSVARALRVKNAACCGDLPRWCGGTLLWQSFKYVR